MQRIPAAPKLNMSAAGYQSSCVRTLRPGNSSRTRNLPGAVLQVPRLLLGSPRESQAFAFLAALLNIRGSALALVGALVA